MRIEVQEFRRACDRLVRFAHQHNGLTDEEHEVVVSLVQALDQERVTPLYRPASFSKILPHTSKSYRITYTSSGNLEYDAEGGTIHGNDGGRVQNMNNAIWNRLAQLEQR